MRQEPNRPARHNRIRGDHAAETAEDYAEAIEDICQERGFCRVTDLAKRFGVSHVTVVKILKRLQSEDIVSSVPYGPTSVTKRGAAIARRARRRHRIVYQFLLALGVDEQTAATDAEGMEHHVSQATLAKLKGFLRGSGDEEEGKEVA